MLFGIRMPVPELLAGQLSRSCVQSSANGAAPFRAVSRVASEAFWPRGAIDGAPRLPPRGSLGLGKVQLIPVVVCSWRGAFQLEVKEGAQTPVNEGTFQF